MSKIITIINIMSIQISLLDVMSDSGDCINCVVVTWRSTFDGVFARLLIVFEVDTFWFKRDNVPNIKNET